MLQTVIQREKLCDCYTWSTIATHTGKIIDLKLPKKEDIDIWDIAHALSHLCRYVGHSELFYSVATHSLNAAKIMAYTIGGLEVNKRLVRTMLFHDASEAYLSDIAYPFKKTDIMQKYRKLEKAWEEALAEKFDLIYPYPDLVWEIDHLLFHYERTMLGLSWNHRDTDNMWVSCLQNLEGKVNLDLLNSGNFFKTKMEFYNYYVSCRN